MRCSTRQFLFLVVMVGLILMRESRMAPLDSVEAAFSSWLAATAPRQVAVAPVALVQISQEDIASHPWPWSPVDYSLFVSAALPFQPPVLAVEPVLAWKNPDPQQMALLLNQVRQAKKMVLGSEFGFPDDQALMPPAQETPVLWQVEKGADLTGIPEYPMVALQPNEELRLAAALGFYEPPTTGAVVRRVPLVFRYRGQLVPSFVLQSAMLWFDVTAEEVTVVPGSHIALGNEIRIPVDAAGTMLVDFTVPMVRFSLGDLILSADQHQSGHAAIAPVSRLKNSFTLLARTDSDARTLALANGRKGSRGELMAAAIATIQKGSFPTRGGMGIEALILFEALVLTWFCNRLTKPGATAICVGVFAIYLLAALGVFAAWQVALPLALPAGLLTFILLFRQIE